MKKLLFFVVCTLSLIAIGGGRVAAHPDLIGFTNPTDGTMYVLWQMQANKQGHLTISDTTGRQVYTASIDMTQGKGNTRLDLSAIPNGQYVIAVTSGSLNYKGRVELSSNHNPKLEMHRMKHLNNPRLRAKTQLPARSNMDNR